MRPDGQTFTSEYEMCSVTIELWDKGKSGNLKEINLKHSKTHKKKKTH